MKKFFAKPKGPEKLTPFPLESPSGPPPPQPRRVDGLANVFGPKDVPGVTPFPLERSPTEAEFRNSDDDARVRRRSSVKADGKMFGWGRDKEKERDKERDKDRKKEQGKLRKPQDDIREAREPPRDDEQWTVITPTGAGANLPGPFAPNTQTIFPQRNGGQPPAGYLPPGASPAKEPVSIIPDMQPPLPPQLSVQRSHGSSPVAAASVPVPRLAPSPSLDLIPPTPPHRSRAGSDSWSRNSSEQDQLHQSARHSRTNRRSDDSTSPMSYGTSPRAMGTPLDTIPSSGRDNGPTTIFGSPLAPNFVKPTNVPFIQPRPAPLPPGAGSPDLSIQAAQMMDPNSRIGREYLAPVPNHRDGYRPTSPGSGGVSPSASTRALQEPDMAYGMSPYGQAGNQSLEMGREKDKKKEKGKFFGLGGLMDRNKDRDAERYSDGHRNSGVPTPASSTDNGFLQPRFSKDDTRVDREYVNVDYPRSPSPLNGGVVQPVTVISLTRKEEKEAEKREKERAKEIARREKESERKASEEETVQHAIFKLCQTARAADIAEILMVMERIDQSPDSVSKDAARAIRKEMKGAYSEAGKVFAAKLWLLGCANSGFKGGNFRNHALDKKFMATIQEILMAPSDKALVNQDTYERIRESLAHLVYEHGRERQYEALRACWAKVKTSEEPTEGYPLPPTHPVYSPKDRLLNQPLTTSQPPLPVTPRPITSYAGFIPDENDDLKRLLRECTTAREHALVLNQAVAYTTPSQLGEKPIVREFYNNCVRDQESLVSQMGWAHSQAERSRMQRGVDSPDPSKESFGDLRDPDVAEQVPLAEEAFTALLTANGELSEALRLHDELENMARNELELRLVQERSKLDRRMDRSQYNQLENNGLIPPPGIHEEGSSRAPSPSSRHRYDDASAERLSSGNHATLPGELAGSVEGASIESYGYSGGYPVSRGSTPDSDSNQPPRFPRLRNSSPTRNGPKGPRPLDPLKRGQNGSASSLRNVQSARTGVSHPVTSTPRPFINDTLYNPRLRANSQSDDELTRSPPKPSAKALGKRPALPIDPGFNPDDMFGANNGPNSDDSSSTTSGEIYDDLRPKRPIVYAYDAVVERERELHQASVTAAARARSLRVGGGGSAAAAEITRSMENVNIGAKTPPVALSGVDLSASMLRQEPVVKRKPSGRWKPWQRKDS